MFKKIFPVCFLVIAIFACNRKEDLTTFNDGSAVVLTASASTLAPTATDSLATVLRFNWTNPNYATDSTANKYILQIDSVNKNFANANTRTLISARTTSFIGKDLNKILLDRGYALNVPVDMEVRVISSYGNNNERYNSNVLRLRVTPYKIPPVVPLPASFKLWANGGAINPWSWSGAPPMPQSELARLDETTWAGVFRYNGGSEFLVLGQNGGTNPYDQKYAVPNNGVPGIEAGGSFGFYPPGAGGDNFKGPTAAGWYTMRMNFQTGRFTTTSFGPDALPQDLWATGDVAAYATAWINNPPAAQKLTRLNSCEYTITLPLTPGKNIKFLSVNGQWQPQFGMGATPGTLGANYGSGGDPNTIPTPAVAGTYKITVNFATNSYTIVP